jgi:hypothetical protein
VAEVSVEADPIAELRSQRLKEVGVGFDDGPARLTNQVLVGIVGQVEGRWTVSHMDVDYHSELF